MYGFAVKQQVTLWQRAASHRSFEPVAVVSAGAAGSYRIVRPAALVTTNVQWYVSATGVSTSIISERVRAVITIKPSALATNAGGSVRFTGHVAPSHAGGRVELQEHAAGGWREVAPISLNRSSNYSLVRSFPRAGRVRLRVAMAADALNIRSYSRTVRLAVR